MRGSLGPGARSARRKGFDSPLGRRAGHHAGTALASPLCGDRRRECVCACVCAPAARPQLLRRVRRAASCARPSLLRLTWGKGDSNLDLCRGGPLPSGSINQSAKPTLHPRNLQPGRWAGVLQAPSLLLPALPAPPPRPRAPRVPPARLALPLPSCPLPSLSSPLFRGVSGCRGGRGRRSR